MFEFFHYLLGHENVLTIFVYLNSIRTSPNNMIIH